ncbi:MULTISPECIES: 5-oxoprolinase subunit PxpB [unclassified Agarivorans]|uniref:5-oxoprolinase subunit PxpB n=1 Tax=unclassified Agarivorans TaxID=2636026 RepID=UPI0026E1AD6F|nr:MULTISPECIES: 5-oxoprolinase subunit PxpB [unclassified Agarivorans]MDO6685031.1 5-oxoprolinase subunit PxpB [Agarivorans sp. 3_MG-2023]MDO6717411.1 5-oxoprolinase subunit PxpB [Agarivorans sp. 2_MG-2023]
MYCIDYVNEDSILISCKNSKDCSSLPALSQILKQQLRDILDIIVAADSLLIVLEYTADIDALLSVVTQFNPSEVVSGSANVINIPVCYESKLAPDLAEVCQISKLSADKVIELHQQARYQVKAIGFMPGFAYLKGLPAQLQLPRKAVPASKVAAGSLAIAEDMTAVYPASSPGGWHIIGQSPMQLFNKLSDPMCPFKVGDEVRFVAITYQEFIAFKENR